MSLGCSGCDCNMVGRTRRGHRAKARNYMELGQRGTQLYSYNVDKPSRLISLVGCACLIDTKILKFDG